MDVGADVHQALDKAGPVGHGGLLAPYSSRYLYGCESPSKVVLEMVTTLLWSMLVYFRDEHGFLPIATSQASS